MPWEKVELTKEDEKWVRDNLVRKAKFLVDENLGGGTTELLVAAGWNAVGVGELGIKGHDDEKVYATAYREDRILLTHDDDFLDDRRFPHHRNPGVAVLPGGNGSESVLVRALGQALSIVGHFRDVYRKSKIRVHEDGKMTITHQDDSAGKVSKVVYSFPKHGPPLMLKE